MYVQLNGLMSLLNNHGKNNFLVLGTQYVALAWVLRRYGSAYDNSAFYPVASWHFLRRTLFETRTQAVAEK